MFSVLRPLPSQEGGQNSGLGACHQPLGPGPAGAAWLQLSLRSLAREHLPAGPRWWVLSTGPASQSGYFPKQHIRTETRAGSGSYFTPEKIMPRYVTRVESARRGWGRQLAVGGGRSGSCAPSGAGHSGLPGCTCAPGGGLESRPGP